jgi:PhnB protein
MKITPTLDFNGNCAEAIEFYEKAFNVKATVTKYSDAPPMEGYKPPAGTENFICHANLTNGEQTIYMHDTTPDKPVKFSNGITICLELDSADEVTSTFNALKEGGEVIMELQKVFWSALCGTLVDKFGVTWDIMVG